MPPRYLEGIFWRCLANNLLSHFLISYNYKLRHNSLIYKDFVRKGVSTGFTYVSKFRNILGTFLKNVYLCT